MWSASLTALGIRQGTTMQIGVSHAMLSVLVIYRAGSADLDGNEWLALYRRRLEAARDPREAVLAVFDAYADHAALAYEQGFRGCGLLNAAAELPAGDPGRAVVRAHKEQVEGLLAGNLDGLLPGRPGQAQAMAEHLAFLLEGAMARAGLEGDTVRLDHTRSIASDLLEAL
jgi:hypothetical protein